MDEGSDEWGSDNEAMTDEPQTKKKAKKDEQPKMEKPAIWNEQKEPLKENEELEFDSNAY